MIVPEWVSILAPFASGAFGVGLAWGVLRQRLAEAERRIREAEDAIGGLKSTVQTETRCNRLRDDCRKHGS